MVKVTPMSKEQIDLILQLAREDVRFWELLKQKEAELKEYYDANPGADTATNLPQPTMAFLIRQFVNKHLGHVPNINTGSAIVPLRGAIRQDLGW